MQSVLAPICWPHRKSTLFLALLIILALPAAVLAHPMGNFTISRYSELFLSETEATLYYVVDMAEIPTFQETEVIDTNGNGEVTQAELEVYLDNLLPSLQENLNLTIDGQPVVWSLTERKIGLGQGDGELQILRIDLHFTSPLPLEPDEAWQASYVDDNFAERLGWQEVVINSADGTTLLKSTAPTTSISDALRAYPVEAQLEVNSAEFSFGPASLVGTVSDLSNEAIETGGESSSGIMSFLQEDRFAELINSSLSNPWTVLLVFLAAFGWGAAHALTPGHGKTIVAAYLVGSRGTIKHAVFLGLTTTLTHTAGVFAVGLITLFASRYILPEQLFPWLGVASGLLVVIIGFSLLRGGVNGLLGRAEVPENNGHDHDFAGDYLVHSHGGGPAHAHLPPSALGDGQLSMRNLFALGVSGGLIPCPSALILMLSAIALQRVGFGVLLIVVFSLGLAGILTGIGVLWVKATEIINRFDGENSIFARIPGRQYLGQVLPTASAAFIMVAGVLITFQALMETGIL